MAKVFMPWAVPEVSLYSKYIFMFLYSNIHFLFLIAFYQSVYNVFCFIHWNPSELRPIYYIKILDEMFVLKLYLCSSSLLLVIMSQKHLAVKTPMVFLVRWFDFMNIQNFKTMVSWRFAFIFHAFNVLFASIKHQALFC